MPHKGRQIQIFEYPVMLASPFIFNRAVQMSKFQVFRATFKKFNVHVSIHHSCFNFQKIQFESGYLLELTCVVTQLSAIFECEPFAHLISTFLLQIHCFDFDCFGQN